MPVPSYIDKWKKPINTDSMRGVGTGMCKWCGSEFAKQSRNQIYCCVKHEEAARNARNARRKSNGKNRDGER